MLFRSILVIDPSVNTTSTIAVSADNVKWVGGVLAPNGRVYYIPADNQSVLQVKTSLSTLPDWMLQAYFNKF